MGAIDSVDLFGLDELIIFAFYRANRARYKRVLDIGANLGLHSMISSRCGFGRGFEPRPGTTAVAERERRRTARVGRASGRSIDRQTAAGRHELHVVDDDQMQLASLLIEKETFKVQIRAAGPLFDWADLAKIDAEGHEKELLLAATKPQLQKLDIMVEIGNPANARAVFEHLRGLGIGMFAQKIGWQRVKALDEVPTSHREGSLFISAKAAMPWPGP
jgi:FkbM family methyltransferase